MSDGGGRPVIDVVYERIAPWFRPIWRAWDWLTGRGTLALAWVLLWVVIPWAIRDEIRTGRYGWVPVWVFVGWSVAKGFRVLGTGGDEEVIPARVARELTRFRWMTMLALLLGSVVAWSRSPAQQVWLLCYTVMLAAAAAHKPGGGKSCLVRAADSLRSLAASVRLRPSLA